MTSFEDSGLSKETWDRLSEDRHVTGPEDVPSEIKNYSVHQLFGIGNSIMMGKVMSNGDHWFYKTTADDDPANWKHFLSLPIEEQANYADVPAKFAPYTDDSFIDTQIGSGCTPEAKQMNPKMSSMACLASLVLATKKLDYRAGEMQTLYDEYLARANLKYG